MDIRFLNKTAINRGLFAYFIRRQAVVDCWCYVEGEWMIKRDPFVDDWDENDYRKLVDDQRQTASLGGW